MRSTLRFTTAFMPVAIKCADSIRAPAAASRGRPAISPAASVAAQMAMSGG